MAMTAKGMDHERSTPISLSPCEISNQKKHSKNCPCEEPDRGSSLDLAGRRAAENRVCPGDPGKYPAQDHDHACYR